MNMRSSTLGRFTIYVAFGFPVWLAPWFGPSGFRAATLLLLPLMTTYNPRAAAAAARQTLG